MLFPRDFVRKWAESQELPPLFRLGQAGIWSAIRFRREANSYCAQAVRILPSGVERLSGGWAGGQSRFESFEEQGPPKMPKCMYHTALRPLTLTPFYAGRYHLRFRSGHETSPEW